MQKFLTTLAVLTVIATPAFAQSFCTCDGTGNVLKFTNNPITYFWSWPCPVADPAFKVHSTTSTVCRR